jgi:hypothetical protein
MQQTTSPPPGGGVPAQGFGRHEVAVVAVPPAAAHSAGVRSSHSGPLSSGMQQMTSPLLTDPVSASCTASTSSPAVLRTTTSAPRGSKPSGTSLEERGRLRKRMQENKGTLHRFADSRLESASRSGVPSPFTEGGSELLRVPQPRLSSCP